MPNLKLSKLQKDILSFWGKNKFARNFYWTGGTLLAFKYLHHRYSVDLDFFSNNLYTDQEYLIFINELKKNIKANKISLKISHNRRQYSIIRGKETTKLELVFFPFPALEKRTKIKPYNLQIDTLTDIMINKILSAYQRNEVKDIYDIYFYLHNQPKYNLLKLIKLVEKKFAVQIEPILLLAKINSQIDKLASLQPLLNKKPKNLTNQVKSFFQAEFIRLARKKIK